MQRLFVIAILTVATLSGSALNGTFGWVPPVNSVSFTGSTLGSAANVSIPALESINSLPPLYLGTTNDFVALLLLGGNVTISAPTLGVSNINLGFFADALPNYADFAASNRFEFDVTSVDWTTSAPTNLSLLAMGVLVDHSGVFSATVADVSGSFTTTGTGSINASFTFATQPAAAVSEPALYALIGLVLCGMVTINRSRLCR